MQTVTKPELYNCGACNKVSLAEQNAAVILHPLQPRNGRCERERKEGEVCRYPTKKNSALCFCPFISCTAPLTNGEPPPPFPGGTRVEPDGLSFCTQVLDSEEDGSDNSQRPGSKNHILQQLNFLLLKRDQFGCWAACLQMRILSVTI